MMRRAIVQFVSGVCLTVALAATAVGQVESYPIQSFVLLDSKGKLFFEGRMRNDQETRVSGDRDDSDFLMQEGVELTYAGYLYHPNLVDWTATVQLGASQQDISTNTSNNQSDGMLLGYSLRGLILREKPIMMKVFASMTNNLVDRSFGRATEFNRHNEGFELIRKGPIESSIMYEHIVLLEDDGLRVEDEQTNLFTFRVTDERDENRFTELIIEHEDTDETIEFSTGTTTTVTDLPDQRDEANITNDWKFGPAELPHTLMGQGRYISRSGAFVQDAIYLTQTLTMNHTDRFQTYYIGSFADDQTDDQQTTRINGEVGVRRKVYDSLDILLRGFFEDEQFGDGAETMYGAELELDYTKKVPVGEYTSNLLIGRRSETESSDAGTRRIVGESIALTGTTFMALSAPGVALGSISVFNLARTIEYVEGVDYELQIIASGTEIRRLIGGGIGDPETVLVDYTVSVSRDGQFTTDELSWSHRLEFDEWPLSIFFVYRRRFQTGSGGDNPGNLDEDESWRAGADFQVDRFSLSGEYEQRTRVVFPSTNTLRANVAYSRPITRDIVMTAGAQYKMIEFIDELQVATGEQDFLETRSAFGSASTKITRNALLRANVEYTESHGRQEDTRMRIGGGFQWHRGKTDVVVDGYYTVWTQDENDGATNFLRFRVTRDF